MNQLLPIDSLWRPRVKENTKSLSGWFCTIHKNVFLVNTWNRAYCPTCFREKLANSVQKVKWRARRYQD